MEARIPARLSAREGRRFAFTLFIAFLLLSLFLGWRGHDAARLVMAAISISFLLAGLLLPGHLSPIHRGWMAFGLAISKVTTPIFMGIIFFVVITPFGVLMRAFGHRPLVRAPRASAWVRRSDGGKSDLERQF